MKTLVFYTKPGCHLCEGLEEKLAQMKHLEFDLELRDITSNPVWFERYQYEIPVLCIVQGEREKELPRFSPRLAIAKLEEQLALYLG